MDIKHQSLVLDINDTRNYTLIKACQGDQKSRYIDCTLVQNGSVLSLTSSYRAIVKASINNEVKAINSCTMHTSTNVVTVELTSTMLDTPGILNCEITIQDGNQIVTSQAFAVQVRQSTVANETEIKKSKEFGALTDVLNKIANVEQNADKVSSLVDNINKLESVDRLKTVAEHGKFDYTATFTADGVVKKTTSSTTLGAGDFATSQTDIVTAFIASNVTSIGSGTFANCTSLKTIYIDNTVDNISIASGAIPDNTTVVYCNDDDFINVNDILANAIKTLKTRIVTDEEQHKADTTMLSQAIQSAKDTVSDLDKNKVNNTDFNNYKTNNDTAVSKNATAIAQLNADVLQNAIKNTTPMTNNVVINDSSDSNIVDLMLQDSSAKVYLYGKNLAEFNSYFKNANGWTSGEIAEKIVVTKDTKNKTVTFNSVNESGRSGINVMWKNSSVDYERLLTKTITISVDVLVTDDCTFFLCNSCDNYKSTTIKLKANKKQRVSVTTTMPSDISKIQNTSILFHIDSTKTNVTLSNFQIELNSVQTDYENYKDSQTVSSSTDLSTVHTNYPTTTVLSDSDFVLTYIADTKNYIDNKINEVKQALIASASSEEVM